MTPPFRPRARRAQKPKPREPRPHAPSARKPRAPRLHTLSFKCFRFVPIDELGPGAYEIVELCDPRNAMRALVFER